MAGQKLVIIDRKVTIDAEGFVKEDLTADEIGKLSRMSPQWDYLDRDGAEIQNLRLDKLEEVRVRLEGELRNAEGVADDRRARLSECNARIAEIRRTFEPAPEPKPAKPVVLEDLKFTELLKLAAKHNVVVDPSERSQSKLIAALRPILNPKEIVDADPQ